MADVFTGNEGERISSEEAKRMRDDYEETMPEGEVLGLFYGRNLLNSILQQEGCMGIRFYLGRNDEGKLELVLVGADREGKDMDDEEQILGNRSYPCPPICA